LSLLKQVDRKSQKVSDSHRNEVPPLTQGLRYRAAAACDVHKKAKFLHKITITEACSYKLHVNAKT